MATEKEAPEFVYVEAGPDLTPGQVAVVESDPSHPYVEGAGGGLGECQARIVKGDPKFGSGYVGLTATVLRKLAREELVRIKPPVGTKRAKRAPADAVDPTAGRGDTDTEEALGVGGSDANPNTPE